MFSKTIEQMLETELTEELGYDRYDSDGEFHSEILKKNSNEIEQKVIAMYAKGTSTRDIQDMLEELYGISVSPETISKITDKVWEMVESWQARPLSPVYAMLYLDAIHAVFPATYIQRCIIHQIRSTLKYVTWKDHKEFMADLKKGLSSQYPRGSRK